MKDEISPSGIMQEMHSNSCLITRALLSHCVELLASNEGRKNTQVSVQIYSKKDINAQGDNCENPYTANSCVVAAVVASTVVRLEKISRTLAKTHRS